MKKISALLIFLILFSVGYSLKLINDLQCKIVNNNISILNNSDLIEQLDLLTKEIHADVL